MTSALHPADAVFIALVSFLAGVFLFDAHASLPEVMVFIAAAVIVIAIIATIAARQGNHGYLKNNLKIILVLFIGFVFLGNFYSHFYSAVAAGESPDTFQAFPARSPGLSYKYFSRGKNSSSTGTGMTGANLEKIKQNILEGFQFIFPYDKAGLLYGIIFGSTSFITKDLKNILELSGFGYLVSFSGFKAILVISAVRDIAAKWLKRRFLVILLAAISILVVGIGGFKAGAIRAAVMGFMAAIGREAGRIANIKNMVGLTAVGFAIIDPISVVGTGFILSFLGFLGIIYVSPILEKLIGRAFAPSIAAELAMTPALIVYFGRFSPLSFLGSPFIFGSIPIAMILGIIIAAIHAVYAPLVFPLIFLEGQILAAQIFIIKTFANFSIPLVNLPLASIAIVLYYSALMISIYNLKKERGTETANIRR